MNWYVLIATAYLAGLTEFVCLCHEAPVARDEPVEQFRSPQMLVE